MCAIAGASSEAAMALIKSPGGTAQRMQARLRAVEMLIHNGVLAGRDVGTPEQSHFAS
jgi:hypothetical protein